MDWITAHPIIFITYSFLFLSILSLWLPNKHHLKFSISTFSMAVIFGIIAKILMFYAVISIALFALLVYLFMHSSAMIYRMITGIGVVVLGFALKFHYVPGFHNLRILHNVLLTSDALPYTFYLNFDEACVGVFLLGFSHRLITTQKEWLIMCKQMVLPAALTLLSVGVLSYLLGFMHFDPKLPSVTLLWVFTNLLIVCVAEEAYFRGFLQKNLSLLLSKYHGGEWITIMLVALMFGMLHYSGGLKYVFLATVAGIGYGWVYARTKHIEASIVTHFCLNFIQFLLFTYPALASAVKV